MGVNSVKTPSISFMARGMLVCACACLLLLTETGLAWAQEGSPREAFVLWTKTNAIPILSLEANAKRNDLERLKPLIGSARVVALGEPAHGVHEPLAFRNRLFQFLVEEQGFTAIATETSFTGSSVISEFIAGGSGAVPHIGAIPSAEDEELLLWMKAYNADPAHPRKLRFYGIDLGLGGLGNGYPSPAPIRAALRYAATTSPDELAPLRVKLEPHLARLPGPGNAPPVYSRAEHDDLTGAIEDLIGLLERERPNLIASSSNLAYESAHRNAIVARQADQVFRVSPIDARPGQIPPDAWRAATARDAAMADNVLWALAQEGSAGRLLLFTHNAHIKNAPTQGGVWNAFRHPPNALGQYLRETLGHNLVIIGTSAGYTPSRTPDSAKAAESLDDALAEAGPAPFLVDLRNATMSALAAQWLVAPKALTANFDSFLLLSPSQSFDLILFMGKLTPLHPSAPR